MPTFYPTSNKPTGMLEVNTSDSRYTATAGRLLVPITETVNTAPRELYNNLCGLPVEGLPYNGGVGTATGLTGPAPIVNPTGFTVWNPNTSAPVVIGPSLGGGFSRKTLVYPGRGWGSASTGVLKPTTGTVLGCFRLNWPAGSTNAQSGTTWVQSIFASSNDPYGDSLAVKGDTTPASSGFLPTITLGVIRNATFIPSGSVPALTFSGGGGSGLAAYAATNALGVVTAINITNGGAGYTSAPTVTQTGGTGSGLTLGTPVFSGGVVTSIPVTAGGTGYGITPRTGFWYGMAGTFDDSPATKTVTMWAYEFGSATAAGLGLLNPTGGIVVTAGASNRSQSNSGDATINGCVNVGVGGTAFLGDYGWFELYPAAYSDTLFASFYQNFPSLLTSTAYSSSSGGLVLGGLTFNYNRFDAILYDVNNTTCWAAVPRPTGGITPYTYQWHASSTSNFTPSGATALANGTNSAGTVAGATSPNLVFSPASSPVFLKCVVTDSTPTTPLAITNSQLTVALNLKPDLLVLEGGDSINWVPGSPQAIHQLAWFLKASSRRVILHPRGVTGAATRSNSPGVSWQPAGFSGAGTILNDAVAFAVADAAAAGFPAPVGASMLGANDAGGGVTGGAGGTYVTYYQNIINYAHTNGVSKWCVHYPEFDATGTQGSTPVNYDVNQGVLQSYQASVNAIVAALPGVAYVGDQKNWINQLGNSMGSQQSGPHPQTIMDGGMQAANWAQAIVNMVDGVASSGGIPRIGSSFVS